MQTINITVAGQSFQIRSDADPNYLTGLAREVSDRFKKLKQSGPRNEQDIKIMAMVAITLLDELQNTRSSYDSLKEKTREFAVGLIARIDELLSRQDP